jgi:hypothetical protein
MGFGTLYKSLWGLQQRKVRQPHKQSLLIQRAERPTNVWVDEFWDTLASCLLLEILVSSPVREQLLDCSASREAHSSGEHERANHQYPQQRHAMS